jgi:polar amino acid transport system substrate-binding protein
MFSKQVIAFVMVLLISPASFSASLRVVANEYPPLTGQALPNNGLATELVRTALNRAGFDSEYIEVPWARALNGLEHDRYDLIVAAWYSADREAFGHYSEPYITTHIRFLRRKGTDVDFSQLEDLHKYSIAIVRGYAYSPSFDKDSRLHKIPVNSFASAARMVKAGRVDLTLEDEFVAEHAFNGELKDVRGSLEFLPTPLADSPLHILVRLSHPQHQQIVDGFNRAIQSMREDGSYQAIVQRHTTH